VDFCATNNAKIPIIRPALAVCRVKKRLAVAFLGFYARSATNCEETALARAMGYTAEEFQKIKEGKK
jgi:phage I-like protein